jgi:peptidoglycan biosynthesis protein MviN/MurJ (putative lipid II flippase)
VRRNAAPFPEHCVIVAARKLLTRPGTIRTFAVVMIFAGGAKIVGLFKEMAVAANFGIGPSIDAYLFLFNILSTPISIWYGTIFATLVPYLIRLQRQSPGDADRFRREFLALSISVGIVVGVGTGIGLYAFVEAGLSGLDAAAGGYVGTMLPWLWVMVPCLFVAQYGASCLMARNRHTNSLYEGAPALVILTALLLLPPTITTLALATVAGAILQLLATLASMVRSGDLRGVALHSTKRIWQGFWPGFAIMAMVQALQSASPVIDQLIAAQLPTGSLSTFGYALRVQGVFLTLIALAVPRVLLPALTAISDGGSDDKRRFVRRWSLLLGGVSVAAAGMISLLSTPIVRLLYQRGSFSTEDTAAVATLLVVMIWQLPFYALAMLYSQHSISDGRYRSVAAITLAMLAVKLTAGLLLIWEFGLLGLATSGVLVFAFQAGALFLGSRAR